MITIDGIPVLQANDRYRFSFYGKSSDTKPVKEYNGMKIGNASTFFNMDKDEVFFYDEETDTWI